MPVIIPLLTPVGLLYGRDCVYLDNAQFVENPSRLHVTGELNGALIRHSHPETQGRETQDFFPFYLIFERVIASSTCELDTHENLASPHTDGTRPSFVEIQNSPWLKRLPVRQDFDRRIYRHFRLYTYDTVLDVFAASYTWQIDF